MDIITSMAATFGLIYVLGVGIVLTAAIMANR